MRLLFFLYFSFFLTIRIQWWVLLGHGSDDVFLWTQVAAAEEEVAVGVAEAAAEEEAEEEEEAEAEAAARGRRAGTTSEVFAVWRAAASSRIRPPTTARRCLDGRRIRTIRSIRRFFGSSRRRSSSSGANFNEQSRNARDLGRRCC